MKQTVFVVDDDFAMRDALVQLLEAAGLQVESHADGPAFLATYGQDRPGCLLLDMAMPGMTGLQVQAELNARGMVVPIVFLTGHGDIPMAVRAVQSGAVDFLEKPIQGAALVERVQRALAMDQEWRQAQGRIQVIQQRYSRLSPREREVMALAVSGLTCKEIARKLDLSPRTVEVHRTHIMHKMAVSSLAQLIHLALDCTSDPATPQHSLRSST
jgi:two-component system response regulator FixJ